MRYSNEAHHSQDTLSDENDLIMVPALSALSRYEFIVS